MSATLITLITRIALLSALFASLYFTADYVLDLQADLALARRDANEAKHGNDERDSVIKAMQDDATEKAKVLQSLAKKQEFIHSKLNDKEQDFRRQTHENKDIRAWADTAVPADVIRLRQHPAQTGTAPGAPDLADSQPVQPASGHD